MASTSDIAGRGKKAVEIWVDAFGRHDLLTYASAIAFHVLKSLIPLALLGIALLGSIDRRDVWTRQIAPTLKSRFDPAVYEAIDFAVRKIFAHNSVLLVAFAALLTIWYVSGGVRGIMGGINRIYEADDDRSLQRRWALSFVLAVVVAASVVGAALLVTAVPTPGGVAAVPVVLARWGGAIVALALAAGVLVRLAPVKRRPKKWASAGAVLVVGSWIVMSLVFRWFVGSLANFKTAAGQLTVFIVLMIYVYASSIVFLVGVEFDELLREDANADERGILHVLFGIGR